MINNRDKEETSGHAFGDVKSLLSERLGAIVIFVTIIAIHNSKSVMGSTIIFVTTIVTKNKGPFTMEAFLVLCLSKASAIRQFQQSIIATINAFYLNHPEH